MSCCTAPQEKMCPMRMNDGRVFTDYRPRCLVNNDLTTALTQKQMVASSYESRMFLQQNAESIMQQSQKLAEENAKCGVCKDNAGIIHPERYVVRCDTVSCRRDEVNPDGFGDGRHY